VVAAAAMAFGSVPAIAGDDIVFPHQTPCVSSLTSAQTECAANVAILMFGHKSDQEIKQRQSLEFWHGKEAKGTVQWQTGVNIGFLTWNQDQEIKQRQSIKSKGNVYGEQPYRRHDDITQTQVGVNVALFSGGGDQSITQNQSIENWSHDGIGGSQQGQGAINISVGSENDQSISQSQSIEIHH
jgi:hypothetical protein